RPSSSSISSTERSTPRWPIRELRGGLLSLAAQDSRVHRTASENSWSAKPRSGARSSGRRTSSWNEVKLSQEIPMSDNDAYTTRRATLGTMAGLSMAGLDGAMQAAWTQSAQKMFVLVHGTWHGGWCWRRVADELGKKGCKVYAPSLTGLAERSHLL